MMNDAGQLDISLSGNRLLSASRRDPIQERHVSAKCMPQCMPQCMQQRHLSQSLPVTPLFKFGKKYFQNCSMRARPGTTGKSRK